MSHALELAPIPDEHIAALRDLERMHVSCEFHPNGLYELRFGYMTWSRYRNRCFRDLALRNPLNRLPQKLREERALQFCKIAGGFAGAKKLYDARIRKACYAKMIKALREVASAPGEVVGPLDWAKAKALIKEGKDINYEGAGGSYEFDAHGDVTGYIGKFVVDGNKYKQIAIFQ